MNFYNESGSSARFYAASLIVAAILICASVTAAFGQGRSTERDNPAPVLSNEILDDLDGSASEYFYKFTAGPGKLTLTFEVKAEGTNAGAMLDLFDARGTSILSDVLAQGVDGGSERLVKSVQLSRKRDIVMRVKGLKYGDSGGTGTYKLKFEGPIELAQGAAPAGPAAPAGGGAPAAPAAPAPAAPAAPANTNLVSGEIDGTEDTLLQVVNVTAPGTVTFSFSVNPKDKNAGAFFAVTDTKGKIVVNANVVRGVGGNAIQSATATFDKAQKIFVVIRGLKADADNGKGTYSVQLSGPATFIN